jgi:hypothetical protein
MKDERSENILDDIFTVKTFETKDVEAHENIGKISDKDKFIAAKQILLGLAILYVITIIAYLLRPNAGTKLLDICMTTFPPLATLILVAYFKDKHS